MSVRRPVHPWHQLQDSGSNASPNGRIEAMAEGGNAMFNGLLLKACPTLPMRCPGCRCIMATVMRVGARHPTHQSGRARGLNGRVADNCLAHSVMRGHRHRSSAFFRVPMVL